MSDLDSRVSVAILTKDQLAAIGSLAIESTYLEHLVENIIWEISELEPDVGKFFTNGVQLNNRLELLNSIGRQLLKDKGEALDQFSKLISDLKIANANRNTIIHGYWTHSTKNFLQLLRDGPEKHPPAIATKRRLNSEPIKFSAEDIDAASKQIHELYVNLFNFFCTYLQDLKLN